MITDFVLDIFEISLTLIFLSLTIIIIFINNKNENKIVLQVLHQKPTLNHNIIHTTNIIVFS